MSIKEQIEVKEKYHAEAMRYMTNAKDTLKLAKKEDNNYLDDKYVKTACGIAYNGILKAMDGYFLLKGIEYKKQGRKTIDFYQTNVAKLDRKLNSDFDNAYKILHLYGYYDGITDVPVVQRGIDLAYKIIKRIEP